MGVVWGRIRAHTRIVKMSDWQANRDLKGRERKYARVASKWVCMIGCWMEKKSETMFGKQDNWRVFSPGPARKEGGGSASVFSKNIVIGTRSAALENETWKASVRERAWGSCMYLTPCGAGMYSVCPGTRKMFFFFNPFCIYLFFASLGMLLLIVLLLHPYLAFDVMSVCNV